MAEAHEAAGVSDFERLAQYLRLKANGGECYVKSKFIADDIGLSASQIGALLGRLDEQVADITVERWAYTNATTWRVAVDE